MITRIDLTWCKGDAMRRHLSKGIWGILLVGLVAFIGCQSTEITSAKVYLQQKNMDKAEEMLLLATKNEPTNPEPSYLLGVEIYGKQKKWAEMVKYFDLSVSISPMFKDKIDNVKKKYWVDNFNAGASYYNALLKGEAKDPDKVYAAALESFNNCLLIDPEKGETYSTLAQVYLFGSDIENAKATMKKAIDLNTTDITNFVNLGNIYYKEKNYPEALKYLNLGMEKDPGNVLAIKQIAFVYDAMGEDAKTKMDDAKAKEYKAKAVDAYKTAIAADPQNPDLIYNLGVLYFQQKDFQNAADRFEQVSSMTPDASDALYNCGLSYENLENYKKAKSFLEQAYALDGTNKELVHALKLVYYRLGETEKVKEFDKIEKSL